MTVAKPAQDPLLGAAGGGILPSSSQFTATMNKQDWDELYTRLYSAYEFAGLRDEYVRSTIGDALDHMIALKSVTVSKLAHTP